MAAVLVAGSLTSCSSDDQESKTAQSQQEIKFSANLGEAFTRATAATTTATLTGFNLYAFDGTTAYMSDIAFSKSESTYTAASGTYYWPSSNSLSIFAWSPASAITPTVTSASQTFTYNISDWKSAVDLVVSDLAAKSPSSAALTFNHMLSWINIEAKMAAGSNYVVTLNSVTLKNILPQLSYNSANTPKCSADGTAADYLIDCTDMALTTTAQSVAEGSNLIMLVPQTLTGAVTEGTSITGTLIAANITVKKNDVQLYTGTVNIPLKSSDGGLEDWAAGKKYTYTLEFGDETTTNGIGYDDSGNKVALGANVALTATVTDWTDGVGGTVTF